MTDVKKVELTEENLDEVAGGNKTVKKTIAVSAAVVAAAIAGYQSYHQIDKLLNVSDGTAKNGNANSKGAASAENGLAPGTYNNVNSGGKQMIVQQGSGNINNSGNNSM